MKPCLKSQFLTRLKFSFQRAYSLRQFPNSKASVHQVLFLMLLLFVHPAPAKAQEQTEKKLIQLSGITKTELLEPLPFVSILNKTTRKGSITDQKGRFSIVVEPKDTVIFASLGFKRTGLIIPDTISSSFVSTDIILYPDTVHLTTVKIYPWKNYEEFKQAFLALKLPKTDLERAQRNIEIIMQQVYKTTAPDAAISYQNTMMDNFNRASVRGTVPTFPIFNLVNWAKFFKALKNGYFRGSSNRQGD